MAKVRLDYEAVRYIAAKAVFEKDDNAIELIRMATYKRYGVGFMELLLNPYNRVQDSARALTIIGSLLSDCVGTCWYTLVTNEDGIKYIVNRLKGYPVEGITVKMEDTKVLAQIFKNYEIRYSGTSH